jgi:uncharacterized phiE125 gp8 family phage protein
MPNSILTVTEAATDFDIVDLAAIKSALGIVDSNEDAALTDFLGRASDVIARHCRRAFALETVQEQFRLDRWREELILSRYPVVEVTSIVEAGLSLAGTDYEVDKAKGMLTRLYQDRPCWWPAQKIVVTYRAGYDLPTGAPEALQQACIQLVKSYYMASDRDPMVRSESVDNISAASYFVTADYLPPDVSALLNQFRKLK